MVSTRWGHRRRGRTGPRGLVGCVRTDRRSTTDGRARGRWRGRSRAFDSGDDRQRRGRRRPVVVRNGGERWNRAQAPTHRRPPGAGHGSRDEVRPDCPRLAWRIVEPDQRRQTSGPPRGHPPKTSTTTVSLATATATTRGGSSPSPPPPTIRSVPTPTCGATGGPSPPTTAPTTATPIRSSTWAAISCRGVAPRAWHSPAARRFAAGTGDRAGGDDEASRRRRRRRRRSAGIPAKKSVSVSRSPVQFLRVGAPATAAEATARRRLRPRGLRRLDAVARSSSHLSPARGGRGRQWSSRCGRGPQFGEKQSEKSWAVPATRNWTGSSPGERHAVADADAEALGDGGVENHSFTHSSGTGHALSTGRPTARPAVEATEAHHASSPLDERIVPSPSWRSAPRSGTTAGGSTTSPPAASNDEDE